jgi:hypothetical protein
MVSGMLLEILSALLTRMLSGMVSGMLLEILSALLTRMLSGMVSRMLLEILSALLTRMLSGMVSGMLLEILSASWMLEPAWRGLVVGAVGLVGSWVGGWCVGGGAECRLSTPMGRIIQALIGARLKLELNKIPSFQTRVGLLPLGRYVGPL